MRCVDWWCISEKESTKYHCAPILAALQLSPAHPPGRWVRKLSAVTSTQKVPSKADKAPWIQQRWHHAARTARTASGSSFPQHRHGPNLGVVGGPYRWLGTAHGGWASACLRVAVSNVESTTLRQCVPLLPANLALGAAPRRSWGDSRRLGGVFRSRDT